jgi:DNA-binding response OmpR family regulator
MGRYLGDTDRIRSSIKRLRRKLVQSGVQVTIESVRGFGFRLCSRSPD